MRSENTPPVGAPLGRVPVRVSKSNPKMFSALRPKMTLRKSMWYQYWYHIDLRNVIFGLNAENILGFDFDTRTGTLPNGAPTGGVFSDLIQRDPVTGAVLSVDSALRNTARAITEGLDYEAFYQLDTSLFGHGNFGTFTFTLNGNYLARFVRQSSPTEFRFHV